MNPRRFIGTEVVGVQHQFQRVAETSFWVRKQMRNASKRLLFLSIKDVKDSPDEQRMGCLVPMVAAV